MAETPPEIQEAVVHRTTLPEARILADLYGVSNDLKMVIDSLERVARGDNDPLLHRALFSAALIAYRRCFNTGVRERLKESDLVPPQISPGGQEAHAFLYALADKLIAHSVSPFEQTEVGIAVLNGAVSFAPTLGMQMVILEDEGLKNWEILAKQIMNNILRPRIVSATTALLAAAKQVPIEEITRGAVFSLRVPTSDQANKRRS